MHSAHIICIYSMHTYSSCMYISPTYPAYSRSLEVVLDVYRFLGVEHAAHDDEVYGVCGREEIHLNTTHTYKEVEEVRLVEFDGE